MEKANNNKGIKKVTEENKKKKKTLPGPSCLFSTPDRKDLACLGDMTVS